MERCTLNCSYQGSFTALFQKVFQKPLTVLYIIVKYLAHLSILNFYLDVLFEVFPRQSVRYALVDIVERLLEYSGSHILLFLVLV